MDTDGHLFLDTLEQMKELLSSPDIASRAEDPFLTKTITEFYELIDAYADDQSSEATQPETLKNTLAQLASKIVTIEEHVNLNLNKLAFLSNVTPKK